MRLRLTIVLERREDGGIRVCSDDVPGLILSGTEPEKVMTAILPALQALNAWSVGQSTHDVLTATKGE